MCPHKKRNKEKISLIVLENKLKALISLSLRIEMFNKKIRIRSLSLVQLYTKMKAQKKVKKVESKREGLLLLRQSLNQVNLVQQSRQIKSKISQRSHYRQTCHKL